jgi:hypothetical protein
MLYSRELECQFKNIITYCSSLGKLGTPWTMDKGGLAALAEAQL